MSARDTSTYNKINWQGDDGTMNKHMTRRWTVAGIADLIIVLDNNTSIHKNTSFEN